MDTSEDKFRTLYPKGPGDVEKEETWWEKRNRYQQQTKIYKN